MAFLETFFRISRKGQIGLLRVDARIKETHIRSSSVSTSVTEMGGNASDNVKLDPRALFMDGFISDTPVAPLGLRLIEDLAYDVTSLIPGSTGTGVPGGRSRSPQDAWKYLELLWLERRPFSVISKFGIYKDMILTSLNAPQTIEIGRSLAFTAQMKEAKAPTGPSGSNAAGDAKNSASPKTSQGKKNAVNKPAPNKSLLKTLVN